MSISNKIQDWKSVSNLAKDWQSQNLKIVFTNGCFDIIHPGHIDYLEKARSLGDKLIIGLNSDESIKRLKGATRPINNTSFRQTILTAFEFVDLVVVFEEDTPLSLIKLIQPNILVKGGDYSIDAIVGAKEVVQTGGKVEIIPFLEGFSSTNVITKIQNLRRKS